MICGFGTRLRDRLLFFKKPRGKIRAKENVVASDVVTDIRTTTSICIERYKELVNFVTNN